MENAERQQIFNDWLSEHKGLVFKVVLAYARDRHDQEDLFQEIAIQLWDSIPRFRGESAVTTLIYRVGLNSAMAWARKEKRGRREGPSLDSVEHLLTQTPKFADGRLRWLYEQIGRLNEVDRSLTLLMLDGYSYREMAGILGITGSNVGVKINRLKKHLINELNEEKEITS